jgi:NitT/TauT family transport system permease protein
MTEAAMTSGAEDAGSRFAQLWPNIWPPLVTLIVGGAIWEAITFIFAIPPYFIPSPSRIWEAFWSAPVTLLYHAGITAFEAVVGCFIGSCLGALLGIAFAYSKLLSRGLLPFFVAANTIPTVAIAPIIILWFGHGISAKVAVTAFLSFFPLALNMMKGLASLDRVVYDVFQVSAATPIQRFFKMRLPNALPYIFVGLKVNASFSVIGAIVAEFVQADRGLGFIIMTTYRNLNMPRLWAALVISSLIGIVFFCLVTLAERWLIPWHSSMRNETST